jgi:hypothetical protein
LLGETASAATIRTGRNTVGEEREEMGSEPEEKDDVEGHYLGDAPSSDAPSLDRDTDEGADVEGHYLGDAPSSDAPSSDYLGDAPSSD